ncbi:MAG: translation initiation factor eIF-2B [Thermoplasmatota archaeon]
MEGSREKLFDLLRDNRIGAVEMTLGVSVLLGEISKEVDDEGELKRICMEVIKKGPIMAPLVDLVSGALFSIEEGKPLMDQCLSFSRRLEGDLRRTAAQGSQKIRDGMKVLTYSNSSTILETFGNAVERGKGFEVIISDAGPVREGVLMAERISEMGIRVTLVPDGALFQEMEDADIIMVGADSITTHGLINKIGTRGLAAHARLLGKELVSVASSHKVLPSGIDIFRKELRDPSEVYTGSHSLEVKNYYFDRTPLHLVSRIVTESGALSPFDIMTISRQKRIHRSLEEYFGKIK